MESDSHDVYFDKTERKNRYFLNKTETNNTTLSDKTERYRCKVRKKITSYVRFAPIITYYIIEGHDFESVHR